MYFSGQGKKLERRSLPYTTNLGSDLERENQFSPRNFLFYILLVFLVQEN
jgi:hypothetical protein